MTDSVRVMNPFKDCDELWLGLDEEGLRRKVFQVVTPETVGASKMRAGLTVFEPGKRCAPHNHPDSEEINIVIRGEGIAYDKTAGTETRFKENDWMFIRQGNVHVHYNDGDEPLWLIWCYAPMGELPTR